jgi:hypothetical protein
MSTERAISLVIANWHVAGFLKLLREWKEIQEAAAG